MKLYELRIVGYHWGTTYHSSCYKNAIKQFLTDPIYHFKPGTYSVEFRNGDIHTVTLQEIKTAKICFS